MKAQEPRMPGHATSTHHAECHVQNRTTSEAEALKSYYTEEVTADANEEELLGAGAVWATIKQEEEAKSHNVEELRCFFLSLIVFYHLLSRSLAIAHRHSNNLSQICSNSTKRLRLEGEKTSIVLENVTASGCVSAELNASGQKTAICLQPEPTSLCLGGTGRSETTSCDLSSA